MTTLKHVFWNFLLFCTTSLLADTWTDENGVEWTYTIYNGLVTIGDGTKRAIAYTTSGEITVPEEINGGIVTYIATGAFKGCSLLTKVNLPSTVKTIRSEAFYGCSALTEFEFPPLVTSIATGTFRNCKNLTLTIPGRITSIGEAALYNVTTVFVEEGITSLDFAAWMYSYEKTSPAGYTHTYYVYTDAIEDLYLPSTAETFNGPFTTGETVDTPLTIRRLHIKGLYRSIPFSGRCEKIYYDSEYAESWLLGINKGLYKWICEGSQLTVIPTLHGGTTSEKGKEVAWGEEVSVTAAAKEGYVFLGWDSDREGIEGTEETITFTMPQAPVTLVANFFPKALLEGWMDTRIDAKVDGKRLMTADQAAEKTAAAIEGKVESGELFTPAGAEAKAAEEIAQKVANKELITADSLQEMALDAPVIEVDASGTAKVGISLQKASSLSGDWEEVVLAEDAASVSAGTLKLTVPAEEGTAFYKFVVPAQQGAQEP